MPQYWLAMGGVVNVAWLDVSPGGGRPSSDPLVSRFLVCLMSAIAKSHYQELYSAKMSITPVQVWYK